MPRSSISTSTRRRSTRTFGVDYSVVSDASTFLHKLLPLRQGGAPHCVARSDRRVADATSTIVPKDDESVIHPHQLAPHDRGGGRARTPSSSTDVGQHQMWSAQYSGRTHVRQFLTSGGLGTMGFGYGAAIGAQIAFPERTVVHVTGDGSFHMNLNEMCTAVSYDLPVITVVMNNRVLGNGPPVADHVLRQPLFADRPAPQDGLCQACGCVRRTRLPCCQYCRAARKHCAKR